MTLQIFDGDLERTRQHYLDAGEIEHPEELRRFDNRARCVWNWIEDHAPEDFRYRIRTEAVGRELSGDERVALERLVAFMKEQPGADEPAVIERTKTLLEGTELAPKSFFPVVYQLLIGRDRGPKLSTLLTTMGFERALPLLEPALAGA